MSGDALPEVKFAAALKVVTRKCYAIPEFVDMVMAPELSPMDRLNRVAGIAYKYAGPNGERQSELVRVWMLHDEKACHTFLMSEDRLRVEKKVRELEKENREKDVLVDSLKRKLDQLQAELVLSQQGNGDDVDTQEVDAKVLKTP